MSCQYSNEKRCRIFHIVGSTGPTGPINTDPVSRIQNDDNTIV